VERAQICEIGEQDVGAVAQFLERNRRPGEAPAPPPLPPEQRLRWLLLENPDRQPDIPLGWFLRNESGSVVGSLICAHLRVGVKDFSSPCIMCCKFYVDPPYRGMGMQLFRRYVRECGKFPLLATSANEASGRIFQRFGAYEIEQTDHTMLGISRPAPLAEEWLHRRTGRVMVAQIVALPVGLIHRRVPRRSRADTSGELRPITSFSKVEALDLRPTADIVAVMRDPPYLRWRYFASDAGREVFHFRLGESNRIVVVNDVRSGHRGQIRVLNILEVWPPPDGNGAAALSASLANQFRGRFDVIWFRCPPLEAQEALREAGFIAHAFPATMGWCIDSGHVLPTENWYLLPGESE
jgi:hypothetical protein